MDKKLQLEIYRVKEIMKSPLLEQGIPGAASKLFRNFFSNTDEAEALLTKVADDANIDEFIIDDFVRVMNQPKAYNDLSAIEKRNLFRLLSEVPDLSDQMFDGVLKTFNMDMNELNQTVYYLMRGPEKLTYLQSINKLFKEAPEVTSLIIKKHHKQFKTYNPSKSAKVVDDVVDEVSGILDDIDATPVSDEDVLGSIDEILNPDTWEEEVTALTDTMAADLAKSSRFNAAFQKIAELFKFTKNQKQQIETLAQTLSDPDVSSGTKQKVLGQLEKKLESVYYKNMNAFVQLRDYFDDVAVDDKKFKVYWDKLRKDSKNDIAFWSTFGKKAKGTNPAWLRAITGFKTEFKSIFELERKIFNGIRQVFRKLNKSSKKNEAIKGFENSLGNLFKSGTRRGFPTLSNENYTKLIQSKGPVAAKVVYLRDLGVNYIRYAMYVSLLEFGRNHLADKLYSQQILDCAQSQKVETNEQDDTETTDPCEGLDNWWDMMWVNWALQRRKYSEYKVSGYDNWFQEYLDVLKGNITKSSSTTAPSEEWYWKLFEMDPGFIGETFNLGVTFNNWLDEQYEKGLYIDSTDQLRKELDELLNKTKQKLEETGDKIVDEANEVVDEVVNDTGVLPQGLKNAVPDQYEDQIEMVGGVWVFHDESGTDYKLKKGDDLKDSATEYPFENESLRSQLNDNVWYVLNPLDGGKYVPLILSVTLTENIKRKGLSILLEQIDINDPNAQVGGGSNSGSGSNNTGSSSGAQRTNEEQKRKEELENRMLAMFEKFMVYDGESGRDLIEGSKLTTRDKESIINDCFDALISKFNGVMNIDEKVVDDTVVLNTILYLINDKKMDPLKIMYKSPLELDAKLMESVGLEKILYEQGVGVNYNTIYINYIDGSTEDKIEFIKGGSAERTARANYNKRLGQNSVQDTPTPSPTPRPQQTSEQRPEEAMEIETPKMMKRHTRNEKS